MLHVSNEKICTSIIMHNIVQIYLKILTRVFIGGWLEYRGAGWNKEGLGGV